jgi:hypothetical protein
MEAAVSGSTPCRAARLGTPELKLSESHHVIGDVEALSATKVDTAN